jgi:hypothetical protein
MDYRWHDEEDGGEMGKSYFESFAGILGTEGKLLKSLMDDKKKEREL